MGRKQPIEVRAVGRSVSRPAWTVGDVLCLVFTAGMALPWVWVRRRRRTMVTKHR